MPAASFTDYADIMFALPGTIQEIAARVNMGRLPVSRALRALKALGAVHASHTITRPQTGHVMAVFSEGEGDSVVASSTKPLKPTATIIAFASMWSALKAGGTLEELAEETGLFRESFRRLIVARRREFHVAAWDRSARRGTPVAVWRLGRRPDALRPAPKTRAQVSRDCRQRQRMLLLAGIQRRAPNEERRAA